MEPKNVVKKFWETMNSNDFFKAAEWLAHDFECIWPQSGEAISGRRNFAEINTSYPAQGAWKFTINSLIAEGDQVVSDVSVSDGTISARAITFHTISNNLISRQVEFWPDDYPAPEWRSQWVKRI
ncbi:MAG: nuclear transport factor 2 family protein [Candidatus Rifleibacteriota bacterium]